MSDLATMLWKEFSEFLGNQRSLRVFLIAIGLFGILPTLTAHHGGVGALGVLFYGIYVVLSGTVVGAQTAPDLVLRERAGHTLEFLLSSRLPDGAIFGGKVVTSAVLAYAAAMLTICVQLAVTNVRGGGAGWQWLYLAADNGRVFTLLAPALVGVYLATIGSFVALRVGDQRAAYMVTMLSMGVLILPFILGWVHAHLTATWMLHAAIVFALLDAVVVALGVLLFRRDRLVLYLQE